MIEVVVTLRSDEDEALRAYAAELLADRAPGEEGADASVERVEAELLEAWAQTAAVLARRELWKLKAVTPTYEIRRS